MPPARKTVYPYGPYQVAETAAKRPFPRHVINIQDLVRAKAPGEGHLVININKDSPEEISIKRSGYTLTVETKSADNLRGDQGVEVVTRSYKVPEGGYTQELGAQLAIDGLVSVRGPGMNRIGTRVIPINLPSMEELKHGRVIQVDPMTGAQTVFPLSFPAFAQMNVHKQGLQTTKADGNDKEMKEIDNLDVSTEDPESTQHVCPEKTA